MPHPVGSKYKQALGSSLTSPRACTAIIAILLIACAVIFYAKSQDELPTPTKQKVIASVPRPYEPNRGERTIICETTAYTHTGNQTASGTWPGHGTIAADTSVLPFGTKVKINGHIYRVEDTGSDIRGNRIDIFMDSKSDCLKFGRRTLEIKILEE